MSQSLTKNGPKYVLVKKHALALVIALRKVRHYLWENVQLLKSLFVPNLFVGKMANWISKIQEFDLEIVVIDIVQGRDLALLLAKNSHEKCPRNQEDVCCFLY
jgi:hypothetical protein